ncbi:MAG: hypothetical protein WCD35_16630 [Mycobacteriales bacterium]
MSAPEPVVQAPPAAPPQYSPDGKWYWDGGQWTPVAAPPQPSLTTEAPSATVTGDHLLPAPGSPLDPRPLWNRLFATRRRTVALLAAILLLGVGGTVLTSRGGSGSANGGSGDSAAEALQVGSHQWCAALLIRDLDYANQQTSLSEYYAKIAPMLSVLTSRDVMGSTMASLTNSQSTGAVGSVSDEYATSMGVVIRNLVGLARQMPTVNMQYVHSQARIACDADSRLTGHPASDSSDTSTSPT